ERNNEVLQQEKRKGRVGGLAAVQPGVKIVPKPDGAQAQAQSPAPQQ
ncbi:hypothetical protein K3Z96_25010, partial [Pseudomonas aeruginosa]|nr:hypothetical protein [Pseudomonas aeruginosa]